MINPYYSQEAAAVVRELKTDDNAGLSSREAAARLLVHGGNELQEQKRETLLEKFLNQFKNFLVLILLAASLISVFVGEGFDAAVIVVIVVLNAVLGVVQENKAEKAMAALKKMASPSAKVIRDNRLITISSRELVPGDVTLLEAGDFIPADIRLVEAVNLKIEESSLTGESVPVEKRTVALAEDVPLAERYNMGFMGTTVTYGRGKGVVVATGMGTEMGHIAQMLQSYEEEPTPLQKSLARFGRLLGYICLAVCAVIFAIGIYKGYFDGTLTFEEFQLLMMTAISLAVASIPEGLPAIVTIILALGMQRMVRKNALIRKLHAVETLGSTTVICSDKTGTLTQNQMTVTQLYTLDKWYGVSGRGYIPRGEIIYGDRAAAATDKDLAMLLQGSVLCNDARLRRQEAEDEWAIAGDPTEGALVVAAAKGGFSQEALSAAYPRVQEIPFDSDRKMMTTFHQAVGGGIVAFVKGAPDVLLTKATRVLRDGEAVLLKAAEAELLKTANSEMASGALRVLAVAYREFAAMPDNLEPDNIERDLVFAGLLGMMDPPRSEAREAVKICYEAGIRPIMITGDNPVTALAVAKELGIAGDGEVITGSQLEGMTADDIRKTVESTNVFARVSPAHKVAIVEALKANGEITAMTGDGVNDAPALKKADIGVAMGVTGTDVTKETADMVLTDDNFASIVAAVEEGRVIYSNIRKCVYFLLSCNLAEILIIFFAMLLGWPIPLLPIHLLWLNLVTDSFPAFGLGMENKEPDVMRVAPRDPAEALLNHNMQLMLGLQSVVMTIAVLIVFRLALDSSGIDAARTAAFAALSCCELLQAFVVRSERHFVLRIGLFSNYYLNAGIAVSFALLLASLYTPLSAVLKTTVLSPVEWELIGFVALLPFVTGELGKRVVDISGKRIKARLARKG